MPRFSAHIGYLYTELDFYARFAEAAKAGFGAVEHPAPHNYDLIRMCDLVAENGLEIAQIGMPAGDISRGEKGMACLPERKAEFEEALGVGILNALTLGCSRLHMMAGIVPKSADRDELYKTYLDNLAYAAKASAEESIRLLIEPISEFANPGYFMNRPDFAVQAIADSGADNAYLLYDVFHAQSIQTNPVNFLEQHLFLIEHIHIADHPGRHEPGTGEINYPHLFARLDASGYKGLIGCEYVPINDTRSGLSWMTPYLPEQTKPSHKKAYPI